MSEEQLAAPPARAAGARKRRSTKATTTVETAVANEPPAAVAEVDTDAEVAPDEFGAYVPVEVVDVVVTLPNPNPVLVLRTTDPPERTFAIPIGPAEGVSIANALRNVATPKPLTHELFTETLIALGASVAVARITAVDGGAFYAEIVVSGSHGQQTVACRPSDAVAMALRQRPPAPIVTASAVLEAVGTEYDTDG